MSPEDTPLPPYRLYAHPLFLGQLDALEEEVARLRHKDPVGFVRKNASKRLAALVHLIYDVIPADPLRPEYRQGHTLGQAHTHWFRAKFLGQYRLFFRVDRAARVIVYAWVNDEDSLRAYGSRTDAYRTFATMLAAGHPPDGWEALVKEAQQLEDPAS